MDARTCSVHEYSQRECPQWIALVGDRFSPSSAPARGRCMSYDTCEWCAEGGYGAAQLPGGPGAPVGTSTAPPRTVFDLDSLAETAESAIRFDAHCFGCSAGGCAAERNHTNHTHTHTHTQPNAIPNGMRVFGGLCGRRRLHPFNTLNHSGNPGGSMAPLSHRVNERGERTGCGWVPFRDGLQLKRCHGLASI